MNHRLLFGFVTIAILQISTLSAGAVCVSPFINTGGDPCSNCQYDGTLMVNRNEACERNVHPPMRASSFEYLGSRILQRAKHGVAGANGPNLAYMPAKDYVGTDDFMVEMQFRKNNQPGSYKVHYTVTVQ